ncbi:MAG: hypothetical protein H7X97_08625 [Opitutaceae bacterium]|nr:hypothetical protein [Verrucomicrobiales bacterium]
MADPGFGVGREPCGGWPAHPKKSRNGCYQHRKVAEDNIPLYTNITLVPDPLDPEDPLYDPDGVPPYPRLNNGAGWPPDVVGGNCPGPEGSACTTGTVLDPRLCGTWPMNAVESQGGWSVADLPSGIGYNSHDRIDSAVKNYSLCRNLGFKNVQARKKWHGIPGFFSQDRSGQFDYTLPECGDCPVQELQTTPDDTRYLTVVRTASGSGHQENKGFIAPSGAAGTEIWDMAFNLAVTFSVDKLSGVKTMSDYVYSVAFSTNRNGGDEFGNMRYSGFFSPYAAMEALNSWDSVGHNIYSLGGGYWTTLSGLVSPADMALNYIGGWAASIGAPDTYPTVVDSGDSAVVTGDFTIPEIDSDDPLITTHGTCSGSCSVTDTKISFSCEATFDADGFNGYSTYTAGDFINVSGSMELSIEIFDTHTGSEVETETIALLDWWDLTDNVQYPWRTDSFTMIAPLVSRDEIDADVYPLPADFVWETGTIYDDSPLGVGETMDDYQQPWIQQGYYEGSAKPALASGAILGKPLPEGYEMYFDWKHVTWRACFSPEIGIIPYVYAHGSWANTKANEIGADEVTDESMPASATQWTSNYNGADDRSPQAGGYLYFDRIGNELLAQKWAEIKVPRPSFNFARPCGVDRVMLDETTVRCVYELGEDDLLSLTSGTDGIETGDLCALVMGGPAQFFTVTKFSDAGYYLTTPRPEIISTLDYNAGSGVFGKVRFPSAPGICGRMRIIGATNAEPIVIELAEPATYLFTGDAVDVSGVTGNTAANGGSIVVTRVDSTHFELDGTTGNAAYISGGYVTSDGAPSYSWHDDRPKGEFVFAEWAFNFRDVGEHARLVDQFSGCGECVEAPAPGTQPRQYQIDHGMPIEVSGFTVTQECLPFSACDPQVLCITPNGESFANGDTHAFPAFTIDGKYGSRWQAAFVQHIDDFYFQSPHSKCVDCDTVIQPTLCAWSEDDGSCHESVCVDDCFPLSGANYYAQRGFFEARTGVPSGAPALQAGHYIGYLSLAALNTPDPVAGNVLPPPMGLGYAQPGPDNRLLPVQPVTPWFTYIAQMGCVCSEGDFASNYGVNGVQINCPA